MKKEVEKEKGSDQELVGYSIDHILMTDDKSIPKIGTIFVIIGGILLIFGVINYMIVDNFVQHASKADGVVRNAEVVFTTDSGKGAQFSSLYTGFLTENQEVSVLYDSKNPDNAKINSFFSLWIVAVLSWIIGLLFILVGSWDFIRHWFVKESVRVIDGDDD